MQYLRGCAQGELPCHQRKKLTGSLLMCSHPVDTKIKNKGIVNKHINIVAIIKDASVN